ncbi:MAG: polyamine ABC transporter ATP-binding protein [Candidatus Paraimprobicoccus trichonymphae]|uniref:Spermidine/putrescine import ATP-binding protein PotA n=1 Tax=Candidatus Paraimprobicoccus trichonymphae TaxID=3033793 RepID=A0AA48L1B9_9FIRM|nr:MAG: polyamine ABC transporter ATP-binding protein [Candidatus Paraimprobicoccus trichonymphae]
MNKIIISLKNISLYFGSEKILDSLNLDISDGEFVTLLGPSGCGKTTILRIIGGFLSPNEGNVFFYEKNITNFPPYKRKMNTIFQKYALFPHLNVYENIAFGLRIQKKSETEIKKTVLKMLEMVNLSKFMNRKIDSLSGGQQQRVAIARALANKPNILLLDEPLGALDLKLRKDMQKELKIIQEKTKITFIFVTHDQEEALSMSDTVIVLNKGKIQQIGTPEDIYNEPKNAFVADFIGESNILDGTMLRDCYVKLVGKEFECLDKNFQKNESVDVVIRPEDIQVVNYEDSQLSGIVTSINFKGVHNEIIVDINNFKWMIQTTKHINIGEKIGLLFYPNDIHIMKKSEYSDEIGDYSAFSDEFYDEFYQSTKQPKF